MRDVKIGQYYFSPVAFLSAVGGGSFLGVFLLLSKSADKWLIAGAFVTALCGSIAQSMTTQRTPSTSLKVNAPGDSVPVYNGEGFAVGQVATVPHGTVTTPAATATGEPNGK